MIRVRGAILEVFEVSPTFRAAVCAVWAVCSGFAQQNLTLKDAVQEAISRHPALAAADHRIAASEALVTQAGQRPNPRAYLQFENLRAWGQPGLVYSTDTDNFAYVSQRIETGHKRERRVDLARATVQFTNLERQVAAREIAARVAAAYWSSVAAAGLRDLLREDLKVFEETVHYHRDRVQQGAMAEVDLLRVLLEGDRLTVSVRTAEQEADMAILTLLREMGRSDMQPVELAEKLPEMRDIPSPDTAKALSARPEMLSALAAVERAKLGVLVQRSTSAPDPEVLFGYKRTAGFDTVLFGLQVDIPRNRNRGAIAAAAAEVKAAEAEAAAVRQRIIAEVAATHSDYLAKHTLIRDTLEPMRRRADEVARIARAAYREGGTDLLRVIDAERARIDALLAYYNALADYQQRVSALQIVLGEFP
jgi:cobalt-zinc-cadmium efflux system outer membrane protein